MRVEEAGKKKKTNIIEIEKSSGKERMSIAE